MITKFAFATVLAALLLVPADAQTPEGVAVRDNGLVATWYASANGKRAPVIITLGGSECGEQTADLTGQFLAAKGFGVLALAYCGVEGTPPGTYNIPLEYFTRALDWIETQPLADKARIGIFGSSIGGETALLVASRDPRIKAVVAGAPSSVIWQGYDIRNPTNVIPTYTLNGQPVPYLPYDMSKPFVSVFDIFERSLANTPAHPEAVIAVERINGPVLLFSGKRDGLWPSAAMADRVIQRLDAKDFRHAHEHIAYPDAGHRVTAMPTNGPANALENAHPELGLGGTEEANGAARVDVWKRTVAFFQKHLGKS
jgi:dienelactone hydrolase